MTLTLTTSLHACPVLRNWVKLELIVAFSRLVGEAESCSAAPWRLRPSDGLVEHSVMLSPRQLEATFDGEKQTQTNP
jgi:hypothetical protein